MQSFYHLTEIRGASGRIITAYPSTTYKKIRASVKQLQTNYENEKNGKSKLQKQRLERLENTALALHQALTHNADGTVGFDKIEVQRTAGVFLEADVSAVIKRIEIEEIICNVTVPVRFLVDYGLNDKHNYGYLLPKIKN